MHTATLGLHEAVTGSGGRARHLSRGAAVSELVLGVAGCLHVGELVRALLLEVIETTNEAHAGLALDNAVVTDVDGLDGGGASTNGCADGTGGRHEQHVDPGTHSVDEGLLQNILLQRPVKVAVLVHTAQSAGTTNTGTNAVTDLGDVDILVELVRVGDTGGQKGLNSGHEDVKGDGIDLGDDVVGDTVDLGAPAGRDLTSNETVEAESLGDEKSGALHETDGVLAGLELEDVDLVAVLALELLGSLLGSLEWVEVLLGLDLLQELLLVGVVAVEQLRLDETDTRVLKNVLLVLRLDVLVVDRLVGLGVNPTRVALALEVAIVVLDETHHPSHLDAALERELAVGLHLPTSSRVTPRSNLSETSDDDDLLEVDHALEITVDRLDLGLPVRKLGEVELHVGARVDVDSLVQGLAGLAVDDLVLDSSLASDGAADLGGLGDVLAELGHELLEVGQELQTTVEVGEDGLLLAEVDDGRGHQTEQVESHLLLGEGAHTVLLNTLSNDVVATHKTSATGPADDSTANGEEVAPVLGVPAVEESLEGELGLRVETVVTEGTVVGRERKDDLGRPGLEVADSLLSLDVTEHAEEVGKHDTVGKLRLAVNVVDLATVLGDGSERHNEVEIPAKTLLLVVDPLNESVGVLLTTLVEGRDNKLGATGAVASVHGLVVLGDGAREAGGGHDDLGATADQALEDLSTDGTGTGTSHEDVLALEGDTGPGSLLKTVEVDAGKLLAVLPAVLVLALQVEERHGLNLALLHRALGAASASAGTLEGACGLAALGGHNLALVHAERANNVGVQLLDLKLRRLGDAVLLANELVDALQVILDLGAVAVL